MKIAPKRIILIAVALTTIALVVIALRPVPINVETESVTCGPMQVTIGAEGKTRVQDRFVVAAPVTGHLERIRLNRGDQVVRDAVVAKINPLPLQPLDPRQVA